MCGVPGLDGVAELYGPTGGCAGTSRTASASLAISGAADMSAVNVGSFVYGPARCGAALATTVSGGRCQRQHEGQGTRVIITATPEWSP